MVVISYKRSVELEYCTYEAREFAMVNSEQAKEEEEDIEKVKG